MPRTARQLSGSMRRQSAVCSGDHQLLNHSYFPDSCAHGFTVLANIGVLCAAAHIPCICSRLQIALGLPQKCLQGTRFLNWRACGSLCYLRWQQPTGMPLPSALLDTCFPSMPRALCRSIFSKRRKCWKRGGATVSETQIIAQQEAKNVAFSKIKAFSMTKFY